MDLWPTLVAKSAVSLPAIGCNALFNYKKLSCRWHTRVPAAAGKAKAGMAHSDSGWTCGCADKTVKSLENTCHTWAFLRWWFTTKRRYIKCMDLYRYLYTARCICANAIVWLISLQQARSPCYHALFGRSALKGEGMNTEPQKLRSPRTPLSWDGWRGWPQHTCLFARVTT